MMKNDPGKIVDVVREKGATSYKARKNDERMTFHVSIGARCFFASRPTHCKGNRRTVRGLPLHQKSK